MRAIWAILCVSMAAAGPVQADSEEAARAFVRERAERRAPVETLRARFVQTKHLKILRDELRSQGTIAIARGANRLVWTVESPEPARVVLAPDGVYVDGKRHVAGTGVWPATVVALLTGVSPDLERHFEMSLPAPGRLQLTPQRSEVRDVFESIELELAPGEVWPTRVRWTEAGGDATVIELSEVEIDAAFTPGELEP